MEKGRIGLPIIYALIAAIVGGVIWSVIAISFDYELGLVAWAIGGIAGYAVVLASKESVAQIHQVIAVLASLIGIILGKYISFAYWLTEEFNGLLNGMFSSDTFAFFRMYFTELFGGMDIIFILLAIVTAWQIPGKHIHTDESEMTNQKIEV